MKSSLLALFLLGACASHLPETKIVKKVETKKTYRSLANTKPSTCFERVYTKDHLKKNPRQILESIRVATLESYGTTNVVVWGTTRKGITPRNLVDAGGCMNVSSRGADCGIDADGGNFTLKFEKDSLLLSTAQGFRLSDADWTGDEIDAPIILIEPGKANGVYRLYKAPLHRCQLYQ